MERATKAARRACAGCQDVCEGSAASAASTQDGDANSTCIACRRVMEAFERGKATGKPFVLESAASTVAWLTAAAEVAGAVGIPQAAVAPQWLIVPAQGNYVAYELTGDGRDRKSMEDPRYFESYEALDVHKTMLMDAARTDAYSNAIEALSSWLSGKVVMDVGGGTGILSILAAKAGAAHVYCIEASSMATLARAAVAANGLTDKITVIHARVETVSLPDDVRVDAMISEWMGYGLLYESMLDSVVTARDTFLRPSGLMLPSRASIYIAGATHDLLRDDQNLWTECMASKYGVDFSPFADPSRDDMLRHCQVLCLDLEQIATSDTVVAVIDTGSVSHTDLLSISGEFELRVDMRATLDGFALWFTVDFPPQAGSIELSTSPFVTQTHWQQTLVVVPPESVLNITQGDVIRGRVTLAKAKDHIRHTDVTVEWRLNDDEKRWTHTARLSSNA